ncbi:hypothetical protein B0T26DRAFT_755004 [Lasiosphaeria miniovina]|uniref:Uncharacterized protein n=1 Tax=Lasiosphaeria miniovina TaxID=1954250 RepID=A0AA40A5X0_9PEZI|nr:uncharacterized protein B0T26DRAFT_755004 [Lasiosphaeria miniovina]KAK0709859.1 hypothetical protein B0T26DRAFT_755004 [Lasiosphaeria miniovina]
MGSQPNELTVRKRRGEAKAVMIRNNNTADNGTGSVAGNIPDITDGDIGKAIAETADWIRELLESKRVVSPKTRTNLQYFLDKIENIDNLSPQDQSAIMQKHMLQMWRAETDRRLDSEAKYAGIIDKFRAMNEDAWYLRYGDYFAMAINPLKGHATSVRKASQNRAAKVAQQQKWEAARAEAQSKWGHKKPQGKASTSSPSPATTPSFVPSTPAGPASPTAPGNPTSPATPTTTPKRAMSAAAILKATQEAAIEFFLTENWMAINERLQAEDPMPRPPKTIGLADLFGPEPLESKPTMPTPLADLVEKLTGMMSPYQTYENVRKNISLYAQRNDIAHRHLGELARQSRYMELANLITTDLKALYYKTAIDEETRSAAQAAIFATARHFFHTFVWDDDSMNVADLAFRTIKKTVPAASGTAPAPAEQDGFVGLLKDKPVDENEAETCITAEDELSDEVGYINFD